MNIYPEYELKTVSVKRVVMKVDEDFLMWWKPSTIPKIIRALRALAELPLVAEISGTLEFGGYCKNKYRVVIRPDDGMVQDVEYLIPHGISLTVEHGARVEKGALHLSCATNSRGGVRVVGEGWSDLSD